MDHSYTLDHDTCMEAYQATGEVGGGLTTAAIVAGSEGAALPVAVAAGVAVEHGVEAVGDYFCPSAIEAAPVSSGDSGAAGSSTHSTE
jgi:hypothetical protein